MVATTLADALDQFQQEFRQNQPEPVKTTMAKATQDLIDSGITDQTLKVGASIPAISLPNATGKTVTISESLKDGPVVISFYRGGWCPYCNLELKALQNQLPEIKALGAQLIAISPETPDASLSTSEKMSWHLRCSATLATKLRGNLAWYSPCQKSYALFIISLALTSPVTMATTLLSCLFLPLTLSPLMARLL